MPEEQQQSNRPSMPYTPNPRDSFGSAMLYMTDTEPELKNFELFLRNCIIEDNKLKPIGGPLVNEYGAIRLLGMAQTVSNKIIQFGKYDKQTIRNLMEFANVTIVRSLMANRVRYKIKDNAVRDDIQFSFLMTIYASLNRGLDEGERRFWKSSIFELRQTSNEGQKSGGGILNKFFKK